MTPLVLKDPTNGSEAQILVEVGFNCFSFRVNVEGEFVEILNAEPDFEAGDKKGTRSGIPWLFPFPNRIQAGTYTWDGRSYALPATDGHGNAIHGFVMNRPWRVTYVDSTTCVAEFQLSVDNAEAIALWPADFKIEVRYTVGRRSLRADILIVNVDTKPLPWGLGTHPYFNLPLSPSGQPADCAVQVPAGEAWELHDFIPTGRRIVVEERTDLRNGVSLGARKLDDVLTNLEVNNARTVTTIVDKRAGIAVHQIADAVFRECVVFTPPNRSCLCLEPYTCTTNAINLQQRGVDAGLRILSPGSEFRTFIEIQVENINP